MYIVKSTTNNKNVKFDMSNLVNNSNINNNSDNNANEFEERATIRLNTITGNSVGLAAEIPKKSSVIFIPDPNKPLHSLNKKSNI